MIETEQTIVIDAAISDVWDHVLDIRRWAALMPGYQSCEVIDDDTSRWQLKVGVGALVRKVSVLVHVERWDGPGHVAFAYDLEGDPVEGGGTYRAVAVTPTQTEIVLAVQVRGSGSMAPMWEAMGRPILPKLAGSFARQLKAAIEAAPAAEAAGEDPKSSMLGALRKKLGSS